MKSTKSLEQKLHILQLAMIDRLSEVNPIELERHATSLVSYAIEKNSRPELMSQLTNPKIAYEYLALPDEEKQRLEAFRRRYPGWLTARKGVIFAGSRDEVDILRKQRIVNQVIASFDAFLKNRKPYDVFNTESLRITGKNTIYSNALNTFDEGFSELIDFVRIERPQIENYLEFPRVFSMDAPRVLIKIFDQFLKKRKPFEAFTTSYLQNSSSEGNQVYQNAQKYFRRGFEGLITHTSQERPDLVLYTDISKVFKQDAAERIFQLFPKFKNRRKPFEVFDSGTVKQFGELKIYQRALRRLEGGFDELMASACDLHSEIREYTTEREVFRMDAPNAMIRAFDRFMKQRKPYEFFHTHLLRHTKENKDIYKGAIKYFDQGYSELLARAAEERPEILIYSDRTATFRVDAVPEFIQLFNEWIKHKERGDVFNITSIYKTKRGIRLYHCSERHLDGGIQELAELASKKRLLIKKYWSYNSRREK